MRPSERVVALEAALAYFRELLADVDPTRGFDSQKRYSRIVGAINSTRDDLVLARLEADMEAQQC